MNLILDIKELIILTAILLVFLLAALGYSHYLAYKERNYSVSVFDDGDLEPGISLSKIPGLAHIFSQLDLDGDGILQKEELAMATALDSSKKTER